MSAAMPCKAHPNFLQRVIRGAQKCHILFTLKGAILKAQKCHLHIAPTSFIWCQTDGAEMPWTNRTKGRVIDASQQCHISKALPTQFNGVTYPTRKRHRFVAPRGRATPWPQQCHMRLAFPTQFNGVIVKTQKCLDIVAPRGRVIRDPQKCLSIGALPRQSQGTLT